MACHSSSGRAPWPMSAAYWSMMLSKTMRLPEVSTHISELNEVVDTPDVVDLAHFLVTDEGIDELEEPCDNSHHVSPIVANDVEQARHDILAQVLQVFEQGSPDALANTSPALDINDR
ncbi:unnamed protein product [Sphagnum troendelagicum]|uniref:Uncharacterized protein n=1 Tax=Sphagnum troendelagicum TaxID=128251 RepID=A0ABP0V1X2_9BRYO